MSSGPAVRGERAAIRPHSHPVDDLFGAGALLGGTAMYLLGYTSPDEARGDTLSTSIFSPVAATPAF